MRKRIVFIMVTACVLLITGCGASNSEEDSAGTDNEIKVTYVENAEQMDAEEKGASENIDKEDLEEQTVKALTMEVLLQLYENDGLALKVEEEGLEGFLAYENMKPVSAGEDSLTGLYICDLAYPYMSENRITGDRNYELQLSYWNPETDDLPTVKEFSNLSEQELDRIETLVQNLLKIAKFDKKCRETKR